MQAVIVRQLSREKRNATSTASRVDSQYSESFAASTSSRFNHKNTFRSNSLVFLFFSLVYTHCIKVDATYGFRRSKARRAGDFSFMTGLLYGTACHEFATLYLLKTVSLGFRGDKPANAVNAVLIPDLATQKWMQNVLWKVFLICE
jgi:hypothetical protein